MNIQHNQARIVVFASAILAVGATGLQVASAQYLEKGTSSDDPIFAMQYTADHEETNQSTTTNSLEENNSVETVGHLTFVQLGKAINADGDVSVEEWKNASVYEVEGQRKVLFKYDEKALYLAYKGFPKNGFACVFVRHRNDDVLMLHASKQLGTALYRKSKKDDSWNPQATEYNWKRSDKMWEEEGWKANAGMSGNQEFAISYKTLGCDKSDIEASEGAASTLRIALGYVYFSRSGPSGLTHTWPSSVKDSSGNVKLVSGWNPPNMIFDFSQWAVIRAKKP